MQKKTSDFIRGRREKVGEGWFTDKGTTMTHPGTNLVDKRTEDLDLPPRIISSWH